MGLTEHKINSSDFNSKDISSLSDRPNADGMSATALKERFDAGAKKVVTPKYNSLIDELTGTSGASGIGATGISGLAGYTVQAILESIKSVLDTKKPEEEADRELEQKFDKKEAQALVKTIDFDEKTGIFTITKYDGTVKQIDTAIEKVALDVKLEGQQFVLTLADGSKQRVDLSAFLTETETKDSNTISITIANGVMSAQIKTGSIKNEHLSDEVTEYIDGKEQSAANSASLASTQAENARLSSESAAESYRLALECQVNACQCASDAAEHELGAENSANNAKTSEVNAAESAEKAQEALDSLNTIPIEKGGTGATTSKDALANLGGLPLDGSVAMKDSLKLPGRICFEKSGYDYSSRIVANSSRIEIYTMPKKNVYNNRYLTLHNQEGKKSIKDAFTLGGLDNGAGKSYKIFGEHNYPEPMANAGFHNSVYRGKQIGTSVSDEQWSAISSGSFDDMFIGDYWTIDGVNWLIAAFDYYYNTGDTVCDKHGVTIVPENPLYNHKMNDENTTEGAYINSKMYTEGLEQAKTTINNAFGEAHILKHRNYFSNATSGGIASGGSWYDSTVDLMNEQNVYGCKNYGNCINGTSWPDNYTLDKSQFPLFMFRQNLIIAPNRKWYWLRDVAKAMYFCYVGGYGDAYFGYASIVCGVRPAFTIC